MKISVPIFYKVTGVPPKKRNPQDFWVKDRVEIELVETPSAAAPVAIRTPDSDAPYTLGVNGDLRWFDESLWTAAKINQRSGESRHFLEGATLKQLVESDQYFDGISGLTTCTQNWQYSDAIPPSEVSIRDLVSDGRQAEIERLEKLVADLLLIDGVVQFRVGEPVMQLEYTRRNGTPWIRLEWAEDVLKKENVNWYRLDRRQALLENHPSVTESPEALAELEKLWPEVLRPDVLKFDDEGRVFRIRLGQLFNRYPDKLRNGSRELLLAWADLRDVAEEVIEGRMPIVESLPIIQHAAEVAGDAYEAVDMRNAITRWLKEQNEQNALDAAIAV